MSGSSFTSIFFAGSTERGEGDDHDHAGGLAVAADGHRADDLQLAELLGDRLCRPRRPTRAAAPLLLDRRGQRLRFLERQLAGQQRDDLTRPLGAADETIDARRGGGVARRAEQAATDAERRIFMDMVWRSLDGTV